MREIKFRAIIKYDAIQQEEAKRMGDKNTEYGIIYFTLADLIGTITTLPKFSIRELVIPWLFQGNKPNLYTNLKDKNKKEIYEGDIIWRYIKSKNKSTGEIREICNDKELVEWGIWEDDEYGYRINTWMIGDTYLDLEKEKYANPYWDAIEEKFKIIGNIYENPELLE